MIDEILLPLLGVPNQLKLTQLEILKLKILNISFKEMPKLLAKVDHYLSATNQSLRLLIIEGKKTLAQVI